jgi:hypothetical protein
MADQWYYSQQGQQKGPIPEEQLRQLVTSGQLKPTDLAWKQGMAQWVQVGTIVPSLPPDPNAPPPLPIFPATTRPSNPVDFAGLLNLDNRVLLGYRIGLVVAAIAVFLPWAQCTFSGTVKDNTMSQSISLAGTQTTCGMIALLATGAGFVLSFLQPALKDKAKLVMGGLGGIIVLVAIYGIITAVDQLLARSGIPENLRKQILMSAGTHEDAFGNEFSSSAGAAFGVYGTLVGGVVSTALGFMPQRHPS